MIDHVMVVAGGDPLSAARFHQVEAPDLVIAADSGADAATEAGVTIDLLVGDLDSISQAVLDELRTTGVEIEQHPTDKDATDLQLAIAAARRSGAGRLTVIGGGGGRIDHLLANAAVVAAAGAWAEVAWILSDARIYPVHRTRSLPIDPEATFSILPVGGPAADVSLAGAKWPLDRALVDPLDSLGISNVATASVIDVSVGSGAVLVIVVEPGSE